MGFSVSTNGSDIKSATGVNLLLTMDHPFTKLDTTNITSFQTISLLFNNEPPQPPAGSPYYSNTLLKQYKHGYNYAPTIWMMWQNDSPAFPANPTTTGDSATTFYPFSDDTAGNTARDAFNGVLGIGIQSATLAYVEYACSSGTIYGTDSVFYVTTDSVNVNLYVMKRTINTCSGNVVPLYLAGTTINIRLYIFTEPVTTTHY